jgi:heptaprenyl diphosphate synthase
MTAKRLCRDALLTAIALTIFVVEAQLPSLVPIPGVKLGLANIVTIWALYALGPKDGLLILLGRILLGGLFAGQLMTLFYSFSGGVLCFLVCLILRKFLGPQRLWVNSVFGAMAHNVGQLFSAMVLMKTLVVWAYGPVLLASGILTGAFTGLTAQLLFNRFSDSLPPIS